MERAIKENVSYVRIVDLMVAFFVGMIIAIAVVSFRVDDYCVAKYNEVRLPEFLRSDGDKVRVDDIVVK